MLGYIQKSSLTHTYFGPQGFQLFSSEEEQRAVQRKFTDDPSWNNAWFIVGMDTELGDPYLINKSSDDAVVYTGVFNGNTWELVPVAETIYSFIECLTLLRTVSAQTSEIFVPDDSTLTDKDILKDLEQQLIEISKCEAFWQQFMVCYMDWLTE